MMLRSIALAFVATTALHAQVTVTGTVYDSLHARVLPGAMVGVVGTTLSGFTDERGRFTIANVPRGPHRFAAQHDVIDALGMSGITATATVTDGKDPVQLAVPSFNRFWSLACGRPAPSADSGLVFGTVRPGAKPFTKSTITVSWIDLAMKGATARQNLKLLQVDTDSSGNYALCGVPTGMTLQIMATADSVGSGTYDLDPIQSTRIVRRDLKIMSRPAVSIVGRVLTETGAPIVDAMVMLDEMDKTVKSAQTGDFILPNVAPGSHLLRVLGPGYGYPTSRIEVGDEDVHTGNLVTAKVTDADAAPVSPAPLAVERALAIFEESRKAGVGYLATREQLDALRNRPVPEVMKQWPGVKVVRSRDGQYALMTQRSQELLSPICRVPSFINGRYEENFDVNDFQSQQLDGIIYYPPGSVPKEYDTVKSKCGALTLITRR